MEVNPEGSPQVSEHCSQCGQQLIEIDNRGERLVGCLTCNLWAAEGKEHWVRLNKEDVRARTSYATKDQDKGRRPKPIRSVDGRPASCPIAYP